MENKIKEAISVLRQFIPDLEIEYKIAGGMVAVTIYKENARVGIDVNIPVKFLEEASEKEVVIEVCNNALSDLGVYVEKIIDFRSKFATCEYVMRKIHGS